MCSSFDAGLVDRRLTSSMCETVEQKHSSPKVLSERALPPVDSHTSMVLRVCEGHGVVLAVTESGRHVLGGSLKTCT